MTALPVSPPRSDHLLMGLSVLALVGLVAALAGLGIDPGITSEAGRENLRGLVPLWIASAVLWVALTGLWLRLRRQGPGTTGRMAVLVVLGVAIAARVVVVATHEPALSDDLYRYVFDGRNGAAGVNPYLPIPEERESAADERWPGERELVPRLNNRELGTLYLPTSQWCFTALGALLPEAWSSPSASTRFFRAAFATVDVLVVVLILVLLRRRGRSAWWAALYAWHPLPLIEIAGSGHQDILGIALVLGTIALAGTRATRTVAWTASLAAAALVKPIVIPLAALLLRRRPWPSWALSLALGVIVCAIVSAPLFLGHGGAPLENVGASASRFSLKWAHFGSVYEPLLTGIELLTPSWTNDPQEQVARVICLVFVAAVVVVVIVRRLEVVTGGRVMFFAMVLFSSTAHPWYLLWALALMPMAMSPAPWIASLTLLLGYAAWGYTTGDEGELRWGAPAWVMLPAYVPVYAALLVDLVSRRHEDPSPR